LEKENPVKNHGRWISLHKRQINVDICFVVMLCRCIWHLGQSITKNLSGVLGERFKQFLDSFYNMNKCVEKSNFGKLWAKLLLQYPEAVPYMEKYLGGGLMHKWATPWQVRKLVNLHTSHLQQVQHYTIHKTNANVTNPRVSPTEFFAPRVDVALVCRWKCSLQELHRLNATRESTSTPRPTWGNAPVY
jgi:hypothetical protein